jgi:hypothetical protein
VAEVLSGEIDKVGNEKKLSPPEVGADKEQDEAEVEEVIENEVAA